MLKVYAVPENDTTWAKFKCWCKNKKTDIQCFWDDNKREIVTLAPVIVGGVTVLARVISRHSAINREQKLKDLRIWDPKGGYYWVVNRKLTNLERLEIERRRQAGEGIGNILVSMKVLKM